MSSSMAPACFFSFRHHSPRSAFTRVAVLVAVLVLASACSTGSDLTATNTQVVATAEPAATEPTAAEPTATEPASPSEAAAMPPPTVDVEPAPTESAAQPSVPTEVSLDEGFSHTDVARARAAFALAQKQWEAHAHENYVLRVNESCECDGFSIESLVLDGGSVSRVDFRQTQEWAQHAPRVVETIFDQADAFISALEDDPTLIPTGECDGRPFFLEFDPVFGVPSVVSDNTPCDGGATWQVMFRPIPRDGEAAPLDLDPFENVQTADSDDINLASFVPGIIIEGRVSAWSDPDRELEPEIITIGDPCQFATDVQACLDAMLAEFVDAKPLLVVPCENCVGYEYRVVESRLNGGPRAVESGDDFAQIVGGIDTPTEAAFALGRFGPTEETADGWRIVTQDYKTSCDPIVTRSVVSHVQNNGQSYEELSWYQVEWGVCI